MGKRIVTKAEIAKAQRYKTARIIDGAWDLPEGFNSGDFVSVKYLRVAMGCLIFECSKEGITPAAISTLELERFCL